MLLEKFPALDFFSKKISLPEFNQKDLFFTIQNIGKRYLYIYL